MKLTRLAVAVAFLVMAVALLMDLRPLSAQGNCGECGESVGTIKKCNSDAAVLTGTGSGNCIIVEGTAEIRIDPVDGSTHTVNCTVTTFYNCAAPEPSGCPIGSCPPPNGSGG